VLWLLGTLPLAAAAAPTGFAAAQSGEAAGDDHAFARAFCFGFGARRGSSPDNCLECLSAAAMDVADRCHGRRGAVWRAGCFLSYADTNTSTPREDAFRGWFYDDDSADGDDTPTAALGRECVANRTAAECSRCLNESAKVVPALKEGRRKRKVSLVHGDAVVVVGYSCYLRVPLFPPMPRWETYGELTRSVSVSFLSKEAGNRGDDDGARPCSFRSLRSLGRGWGSTHRSTGASVLHRRSSGVKSSMRWPLRIMKVANNTSDGVEVQSILRTN
jgi:hypothetical protein